MAFSRQSSSSGFTLVEVAMAAVILLSAFVGMIEALGIGSEMLDTARKQTIAAQVIQSEVEYLRLQPWTTISALTTTSTPIPVSSTDSATPLHAALNSSLKSLASAFTYTLTVAPSDPHANLRQITITVNWTSITGKNHSRSSTFYAGKTGLNVAYQRT